MVWSPVSQVGHIGPMHISAQYFLISYIPSSIYHGSWSEASRPEDRWNSWSNQTVRMALYQPVIFRPLFHNCNDIVAFKNFFRNFGLPTPRWVPEYLLRCTFSSLYWDFWTKARPSLCRRSRGYRRWRILRGIFSMTRCTEWTLDVVWGVQLNEGLSSRCRRPSVCIFDAHGAYYCIHSCFGSCHAISVRQLRF